VGLPALADFSVRWQGLHPEQRGSGSAGLTRALQQLRGASMPAPVWLRDVLPGRVAGLAPARLAEAAGEDVVWVASGGDPRRARARLFFRGEGALFLGAEPELPAEASDAARQVTAFLRAEGASTWRDLRACTVLPPEALLSALHELVLAGIVTNDHLAVLDVLTSGGLA